MSFDFFNTSNLAFGAKLTAAFESLDSIADDAESNLIQVYRDQELYAQYNNRNYQCPFPNSATAPCQAKVAYDMINDGNILVELSRSNGILTCRYNLFNTGANKFTIGVGNTDLTEGYAYMSNSVSNSNSGSEIKFVSSQSGGKGHYLFHFKIDAAGRINIVKDSDATIQFITGDELGYTSLTKGSNISLPYTATDYCCVCIISPSGGIYVYKNGTPIYTGWNNDGVRHVILYLKKGDVVSTGSNHWGFLINYNR